MTGLDLLTELRRNGLRQKDLAARLGVSAGAISKYVNDHKRITPQRAEVFMRAIHGEPSEPKIAMEGQASQEPVVT